MVCRCAQKDLPFRARVPAGPCSLALRAPSRHLDTSSRATHSYGVDTVGNQQTIKDLVDRYRSQCLWFLKPDYYPRTREETRTVLGYIERYGDRLEVRDWIDVLRTDAKLQPFGYITWAACGKDPGYNPKSGPTMARDDCHGRTDLRFAAARDARTVRFVTNRGVLSWCDGPTGLPHGEYRRSVATTIQIDDVDTR